MDVRQLTYFLAIADHGGFGRAAEHLHVAQPSLSQAMRTLERELGVALFRRTGRGVVLSDAGHELIEPARQVVRDLEAARAAVGSIKGFQRGHVDIASMPSPGIEPLASMLAAFTQRFPRITVSIDGSFTPDEVLDAVRGGTAEIGLLGVAAHRPVAGLGVIELEDQPLVLLSPPGSSFDKPDTVHPDELSGLRLIVSHRGSLMRQLVDDVLARGIEAIIAVEVAHRTSILPLVARGVGHAVMSSSWTEQAESAGIGVRRIEPGASLRTALVHRLTGLTPASRAFLATAVRERPTPREPDQES